MTVSLSQTHRRVSEFLLSKTEKQKKVMFLSVEYFAKIPLNSKCKRKDNINSAKKEARGAMLRFHLGGLAATARGQGPLGRVRGRATGGDGGVPRPVLVCDTCTGTQEPSTARECAKGLCHNKRGEAGTKCHLVTTGPLHG